MPKNKNTPYTDAAKTVATDATTAFQTLYDNIVPGQKKQIVKVPEVKQMFDFYGVVYNG